ncbi:hypothetical protein HRbin39_00801 [bacterium HR39]|nr:hypothetical protein HRbin39_00801 [bacterium HR39]
MAGLRHAELLHPHHELAHVRTAHPSAREGDQLVAVGSAADGGEVVEDAAEDVLAAHPGGEQSLDVLHHEGGRPQQIENAQVLAVEEVAAVALGVVARVAGVAGAADQRIGLTGRAADQHGIAVPRLAQGHEARSQLLEHARCAELAPQRAPPRLLPRARVRLLPLRRAPGIGDPREVGARQAVQQAQEAAQPQGAPGRRILLDRQQHVEGGGPVRKPARGEPLGQPARAGEEIDDRVGPRHPMPLLRCDPARAARRRAVAPTEIAVSGAGNQPSSRGIWRSHRAVARRRPSSNAFHEDPHRRPLGDAGCGALAPGPGARPKPPESRERRLR